MAPNLALFAAVFSLIIGIIVLLAVVIYPFWFVRVAAVGVSAIALACAVYWFWLYRRLAAKTGTNSR